MNPNENPYLPQKQSKLPLALVSLLFLLTLIFAVWSFAKMTDYKNNSDKKAAAAVSAAKSIQAAELQKQFDEQSKSPNTVYKGSPTYGSLTFSYPKTWNAYDNSDTTEPINTYYFNGAVPNTNSDVAYPLRVELVATDYAQVIQQFDGDVSAGTLKASAYIPPKMNGVVNVTPGMRFDGTLNQGSTPKQGSMVVIKLRDKTLQIYSLNKDSLADFNNVLQSLSFIP